MLHTRGRLPVALRPGIAMPWILTLVACMSAGGITAAEAQQTDSGTVFEVGVESLAVELLPAVHVAWPPPQTSTLLFPRLVPLPTDPTGAFGRLGPPDDPVPSEDIVKGRNDAMLNGALIVVGALGVFDNVVVHWILGWHRIIEDHPHALELEIAAVAASTALLVTGIVRERNARRRAAGATGCRCAARTPRRDPRSCPCSFPARQGIEPAGVDLGHAAADPRAHQAELLRTQYEVEQL
jgi:hypothetical protein